VATIDAAADMGETLSARRPIRTQDFAAPGQYREFHLDFIDPMPQPLGYRTYFRGQAELWLDKVEVLAK